VSLYTPEVKQYIFSRDWPKGLIMDVYESEDPAPHLRLVFYRDNWLTLEPEQHVIITNIVKDIMEKLWGDGIPTYVGKMANA
jgi:hypothetical protein